MSRLEEIKSFIIKNRYKTVLNNLTDLDYSNKIEHFIKEYAREVAQASLERASEKTTAQYVRPITLNYQDIKNLITNPDNILML